jgi:hypothetical protein
MNLPKRLEQPFGFVCEAGVDPTKVGPADARRMWQLARAVTTTIDENDSDATGAAP